MAESKEVVEAMTLFQTGPDQCPLRTRVDLLVFIRENADRSAIRRAVTDGTCENYGAFLPLYPSEWPGWLVRITSKYGKTWYVAVIADDRLHKYRMFYPAVEQIVWVNWVGGNSDLFKGDNPHVYEQNRKSGVGATKPGPLGGRLLHLA